ncbi:hypothetical protein DM02DRAFT_685879 [Periconia macrospinosa]|uniref:Uncharacterized protein n=1 Tax=Periconia macrospinosa TaxID=97972 RepID=A0A2V1DGF0_9PLEO|nr:hypothetical protein DM02DRAFT_685879 [Periconia macrospinosa]
MAPATAAELLGMAIREEGYLVSETDLPNIFDHVLEWGIENGLILRPLDSNTVNRNETNGVGTMKSNNMSITSSSNGLSFGASDSGINKPWQSITSVGTTGDSDQIDGQSRRPSELLTVTATHSMQPSNTNWKPENEAQSDNGSWTQLLNDKVNWTPNKRLKLSHGEEIRTASRANSREVAEDAQQNGHVNQPLNGPPSPVHQLSQDATPEADTSNGGDQPQTVAASEPIFTEERESEEEFDEGMVVDKDMGKPTSSTHHDGSKQASNKKTSKAKKELKSSPIAKKKGIDGKKTHKAPRDSHTSKTNREKEDFQIYGSYACLLWGSVPWREKKVYHRFARSDITYWLLRKNRKGLQLDTGVSSTMQGETFGHRDCLTALRMMQQQIREHEEQLATPDSKPTTIDDIFKDHTHTALSDTCTSDKINDLLKRSSTKSVDARVKSNKVDAFLFAIFVLHAAKTAQEATEAERNRNPIENMFDGFEEALRGIWDNRMKQSVFLFQMNKFIKSFILSRTNMSEGNIRSKHQVSALRLLRSLHDLRLANRWNVIHYRTSAMNKLMEMSKSPLKSVNIDNILEFASFCDTLLARENLLRMEYRSGGILIPYGHSYMGPTTRFFYRPANDWRRRLSISTFEYKIGWQADRETARARYITTLEIKGTRQLVTTHALLCGDFLGFVTGEVDHVDGSAEVSSSTHFPGPDGLALRPSPDCPFRMLLERKEGDDNPIPNVIVTAEVVGLSKRSFRWPVFCLGVLPAFSVLVASGLETPKG